MSQRPSSPLALAVLALLYERPMHPYEMAAVMRERGKEKSIKLRYGSLYTVIDALRRDDLIASREKVRQGRRPERTIFEITRTGTNVLKSWMAEILSQPVKEYPQFEAGLSLLPTLPPQTVIPLLTQRLERLTTEMAEVRSGLKSAADQNVPALFLVETEYYLALLQTERKFVEQLVERIRTGNLDGVEVWKRLHSRRRSA
jgi:DNA-binding PadR family transcriptional regulator